MDVQNISGSDIVSNKLSVNTDISNESQKPEEEAQAPQNPNNNNVEKNKGAHIDTFA